MAGLRPELERIIGDAVRDALGYSSAAPVAPAAESSKPSSPVRLPLRIRCDEDARALIRCFKAICASAEWRQRFLDGSIELDVSVASAAPAEAGAGAAEAKKEAAGAHGKTLAEPVITEAVLRRHAERGQPLIVATRAVITPAARDYARSMGIRLERSGK